MVVDTIVSHLQGDGYHLIHPAAWARDKAQNRQSSAPLSLERPGKPITTALSAFHGRDMLSLIGSMRRPSEAINALEWQVDNVAVVALVFEEKPL